MQAVEQRKDTSAILKVNDSTLCRTIAQLNDESSLILDWELT
jgi:hypothetical protein